MEQKQANCDCSVDSDHAFIAIAGDLPVSESTLKKMRQQMTVIVLEDADSNLFSSQGGSFSFVFSSQQYV